MDLFKCLTILPTDYKTYGGQVLRWEDDELSYPDCSGGCKHFLPLSEPYSMDWGVCCKLGAPRCGLLTWEHQAGLGCFEAEDANKAE
jgi:hypothetical protein